MQLSRKEKGGGQEVNAKAERNRTRHNRCIVQGCCLPRKEEIIHRKGKVHQCALSESCKEAIGKGWPEGEPENRSMREDRFGGEYTNRQQEKRTRKRSVGGKNWKL